MGNLKLQSPDEHAMEELIHEELYINLWYYTTRDREGKIV